jgi:hypothetical protein
MAIQKKYKVAAVTFAVFMTEAILHYNFGAHKHTKDKEFKLPPTKDLLKIAGVCAVFSLLNGYIVATYVNGTHSK